MDSSRDGISAQIWPTAVRQTRSAHPTSYRLDDVAGREADKAIYDRIEKVKSVRPRGVGNPALAVVTFTSEAASMAVNASLLDQAVSRLKSS